LDLKVRQKIKIASDHKGENRGAIKVRPLVHDSVQPYGLVLQNDVIRRQEYQIDVAESFSCQLRQDVELSAAKAGIVCQNGQIEIAPGIGAPGGD